MRLAKLTEMARRELELLDDRLEVARERLDRAILQSRGSEVSVARSHMRTISRGEARLQHDSQLLSTLERRMADARCAVDEARRRKMADVERIEKLRAQVAQLDASTAAAVKTAEEMRLAE